MHLIALTTSLLVGTALAVPAALELPSKTIEKRATTICGQWDTVETGGYTLYQDLWGESAATSGSQCSTLDSVTGSTVVWSTSWTWAGGSSSVKSFANVVVTQSTGYEISTISTIPTTWKYSYTGTSLVADVAYDMFTSSTATGSDEYEIMIWLAALGGAGPISSTGSAIATPTIAGSTWNLFYGLNGSMKVYSFVASSQITSFTADLKLFFAYLASSQGYPTSQYLLSIGAGTEPFTGTSAVLSVSAYSVVINLSSGTGTATTTGSSSTTTTSSSGTGAALYAQCGGTGFTGPTTCASGTCTYSSEWYSQCLP